MTAEEIRAKTGIVQRLYTELDLEERALRAARAALVKSGRQPEEIGAVLFCSCTSTRACPSVAAWISGQLGILQTHASYDLVAACAGLAYGLSQAARLPPPPAPLLLSPGPRPPPAGLGAPPAPPACSRRAAGPPSSCAPRSSP